MTDLGFIIVFFGALFMSLLVGSGTMSTYPISWSLDAGNVLTDASTLVLLLLSLVAALGIRKREV